MKLEVSKLEQKIVKFKFEESAEELGLKAEGVEFDSSVRAEIEVTPSGESFLAWAKIQTCARLECARCLLIYSSPIQVEFNLFIEEQRPGLVNNPENEEVVVIDTQDKFIDVSDRVRQAITLSLPLKPLCKPDCKGLCHICGADLNTSPCSCRVEGHDSRWDELKEVSKRGEE